MEQVKEKFTIKITGRGMIIVTSQEKSLHFTAGEALMLLDILRNEEATLKEMAEQASPLPIKIQV
jgi:hypothetical protein